MASRGDTTTIRRLAGMTRRAPVMLALLLAACASHDGIAPRSSMNDPASLSATRSLQGVRLTPAAWPEADWWKSLGDPQLGKLIEEALAGNPTIGMAQARVVNASAAIFLARAKLGLSTEFNADASRQRNSRYGTSVNLAGRTFNLYELSLDFSHQFDFWNRHQSALEAAVGRLKAAEVDVHAARLTLSAAVARAYIQLALYAEQLDIVRASLRQREGVLALARSRHDNGLDTAVDLRLAEAAIPDARARMTALEGAIALTRNELAALLGKGPDRGLDLAMPRLQGLMDVALPSDLPADLVGRRPDIVASRWRIQASQKEIDSAKAAFYPNINIAAYIGLQGLSFTNLLLPGAQIFGLTPAFQLPLFGGATLQGNLTARDAEYDLAVEQYNQLLIESLRQVADQVAAMQSIDAQRSDTEQSLAAENQAHQLASIRYQSGLANRLPVLISETQVLARRMQIAELRARRFEASINLIRALGGGYEQTALPRQVSASESAPTP